MHLSFQFYGCYFHGCEKCQQDRMLRTTRINRHDRTMKREQYIRNKKFNIVSMWECDFNRLKKTELAISQLNVLPPFTRKHLGSLSSDYIITAIKSGELYRAVEVDISVSIGYRMNE